MKVVYTGPHTEVTVPHDGHELVFVRNQPTDCPHTLAIRLLEQDTWTEPEPPVRKRKEA